MWAPSPQVYRKAEIFGSTTCSDGASDQARCVQRSLRARPLIQARCTRILLHLGDLNVGAAKAELQDPIPPQDHGVFG